MPPGDEAAGAVLRMQVAVGVDHRVGTQAEAEVAADAAAVVGHPADVVIRAALEAARQAERGTGFALVTRLQLQQEARGAELAPASLHDVTRGAVRPPAPPPAPGSTARTDQT